MTNPCRRHFVRTTAAAAAAAASPGESMAGANAYEQQLAQLHQDRLRLKQIQSGQGKAELKRQLLPAYESYIAGVLERGNGAQDEVITTIMLWCMDAGQYVPALDLAAYVLRHGLKLPDRFARTAGCVIAEEIANAALSAQKAGNTFDHRIMLAALELTASQDMPDEVRSKLRLALGRAALAQLSEESPDLVVLNASIEHLQAAIALHARCGGVKDLERAERLLKKHAPPG